MRHWVLQTFLACSIVLYCIELNYYTGTPLSPEDYFPGSPVKVEQQTYTHTTHNTVKSVSKSVNQSVSSVDGRGVHFSPLLLEVSPCHPISSDQWSSLELLGHLHPPKVHIHMYILIVTYMCTCDVG